MVSEAPFFRREAKAAAFREWLESVGAYDERLSEGSFQKSDRPTGVACRIIVVGKQSPVVSSAGVDQGLNSSVQAEVSLRAGEDSLAQAATVSPAEAEARQQDWRFDPILRRGKTAQTRVVAEQGVLF